MLNPISQMRDLRPIEIHVSAEGQTSLRAERRRGCSFSMCIFICPSLLWRWSPSSHPRIMGIRLFKSEVLSTRPELKRRLRGVAGLAGRATQPGEAGQGSEGPLWTGIRRARTLEGQDWKESQLYPERLCDLVGPDPLCELERRPSSQPRSH